MDGLYILLDMIIPDIDGAACYARLKSINPQVRVIITSGLAKTSRIEEVEKQGVAGFLQKSYSAKEVSMAIRQVLKQNI